MMSMIKLDIRAGRLIKMKMILPATDMHLVREGQLCSVVNLIRRPEGALLRKLVTALLI